MNDTAGIDMGDARSGRAKMPDLKVLVGSGEQIGLLVLPVLVGGVALNIWRPSVFSVGGPSEGLRLLSMVCLIPGLVVWAWSVALILTKVPKHELITTGPFALVKHPLYTGVALLVLPWAGFLFDTWLGVLVGLTLYAGSRIYAPAEERLLAREFGAAWDDYASSVRIPWL